MGWWLAFAIFLYFVCAALLIAEIFVPSGGLITICALLSLAGGIALFFRYSVTAGWIGVAVAFLMIPSVLIVAYRMFPRTRFGRSVTLQPPKREQGDAVPDTAELRELLGRQGEVLTPLRPVGMCDFSGRRVECMADGGYLGKGSKVKVIDVESTQVKVRPVEDA
jgi:membrane-bound ClpP family serine protease